MAAVTAVATFAVLTRALHLDGLADVADGLGSAKPRTQALEIMKRSDIGPFGVVSLVLVLALQIACAMAAYTQHRGGLAIIVAAVTGRLAVTLACTPSVPSARPDGLGAWVAGSVSTVRAAVRRSSQCPCVGGCVGTSATSRLASAAPYLLAGNRASCRRN